MNYRNIYDSLIDRARLRTNVIEFETHHIIPRCIGGTDDSDNLVKLTLEEHYLAHQLLVKIHPNDGRLVYAAMMMCVGRKSNKIYGWLKRKYRHICKQRIGDKNGSFGRRWYTNPITLESGKFIDNEVPVGWVNGRRIKKELKPRKTTSCIVCGVDTHSRKAKWCDDHRPDTTAPIRKTKQKDTYTDEEKISALILHDGKIRHALFHLGLNDSGVHYKKMKELKASLYPLATNQLKG